MDDVPLANIESYDVIKKRGRYMQIIAFCFIIEKETKDDRERERERERKFVLYLFLFLIKNG